MAGLLFSNSNTLNFLYTNQNNRLMSPYGHHYGSGVVITFYISDAGYLNHMAGYSIASEYGLRPVLSIKGDLKVSGTGSANDPYKII